MPTITANATANIDNASVEVAGATADVSNAAATVVVTPPDGVNCLVTLAGDGRITKYRDFDLNKDITYAKGETFVTTIDIATALETAGLIYVS